MSSKNLIAEMEFEITSTTKLLERIPEEKLTWKPNEKAMSLAELAFHVATIPSTYLTYANEGKTKVEILVHHHIPNSKKEIINSFPVSIEKAKSILNNATEEWYTQNWELLDGNCIFTIPRSLFCRLLVFNHWYHHRGELVTYLRTLGVAIPSVYGPSADENPFA